MSGSEYVPQWKLRQVLGIEAAEALIEALGGQRVFVPSEPHDGNALVRAVGLETAEKLAHEFRVGPAREGARSRGCTIEIPIGNGSFRASAKKLIVRMIEEDRTTAEICRNLGVSERTVRRWRRRLEEEMPRPAARMAAMKVAAE